MTTGLCVVGGAYIALGYDIILNDIYVTRL